MNVFITITEARSLIDQVLLKHGYSTSEAQTIGDVILFGSLSESSQGMNKLFGWHSLRDKKAKEPAIEKINESIFRCNANRNSGMYANSLATVHLLQHVKSQGLALVGVSNFNNSSGPLSYYTRMISKAGYIGIMFASADPIGGIAPKGRKIGVFGTNPLSFSVPYKDKDITLDMSTAKYTWGDLVKADIEKRRLDEGFAFDSEGNPTTDPKEAMNGNVSSFDGSYKGLGIAFMIQILAGALVGSAYEQSDENCDYGSLIIAIDPQKLGGTVFMQEQTSKMINALKIKADSNDVLLPGEQSNAKYERNFKSKTIPVDENLYEKIKVELMSK